MILIDGSKGEGGGQVLRSALALSLVTGLPFRIENIRAGRAKPGLMRQHLTAALAAREIGDAEVVGAEIGSKELEFRPGRVRAGDYHFAVGTAGSCTLVLQTLLPALLRASGPSTIRLEGGTHNPLAPPFDFLAKAFLPLMGRMGARIDAVLERPGFFPAGGGRMSVRIEPAVRLRPLDLAERGGIRNRRARAIISQLPESIALRELEALRQQMALEPSECSMERDDASVGPGNVLMLEVEAAFGTEVFTGFGEKHVSTQKVVQGVVAGAREYLASDVPVGRFLADQLLIPLAMAGGGRFRTLPLSRHTTTNMEIVGRFLPVKFGTTTEEGRTVEIRVAGMEAV